MAAWATTTDAQVHWDDASALAPTRLQELLDIAQEQCEEYAPAHAEPVPARYKLAVIYQARETYTASQRDESDVIGFGDYAIRARPLTSTVKQLLRPQRGVPVVG